jgi:glycosyltransferase involved in cell wall biosynthesis
MSSDCSEKVMKNLLKPVYKSALDIISATWEPNSRLILVGDNAGWVLDWEMREVGRVARQLGIRVAGEKWRHARSPQSLFFASQFFMLRDDWINLPHRIGFSYFHGLPDTGDPLFDQVYESLCKNHKKISRIQVSHTQMRDAILKSGIDPSKVFLIPIGINLGYFPFQTVHNKLDARKKMGIPEKAFVVGSFQKDGVGWADGMEPKLIKGPDIFLSVIRELKSKIPELFVLLSGPSRGYVKAGLDNMKVAYHHIYLNSYPQINLLFQALDVYLVTSRQEGGPKAILESMASGVPIVSTSVGQAMDLIEHGKNGWLTKNESVDELVHWAIHINNMESSKLSTILAHGRMTAEKNSYEAQVPLWSEFMKGFVSCHH